jgi:hypothetical protein
MATPERPQLQFAEGWTLALVDEHWRVEVPLGGRRQRVELAAIGPWWRIWSTAVRPEDVPWNRDELMRDLLLRNRGLELVRLEAAEDGAVVGRVDLLRSLATPEDLTAAVRRTAAVCDRLEFLWSGVDWL